MNTQILIVIGGIIIAGLTFYASFLLAQVYSQRQKRTSDLASLGFEARNDNIFESMMTLCAIGIQGQCDLSEVCFRLYCIAKCLQGERKFDIDEEFPSITALYHTVKDMARGDERQLLGKTQRMKQKLQRLKAESKLSESILKELPRLKEKALELKALSSSSNRF